MAKISTFATTDDALTDFLLGDTVTPTTVKFAKDRLLGFGNPSICNGRLTTQTGVPVSTADRTAQGTIFFTPYNGNRVSLFDGTRWRLYSFAEVSLALTVTSGKNYDVYLYDNAGTLTLELSAAWTNDTTRADATALQDGILSKSGTLTRRLVGTIRASGANVTEDSLAKRFVGNLYNKVSRPVFVSDATASWNYTTNTLRQANANVANQIDYVSPDTTTLALTLSVGAQSTSAGTSLTIGIGLDSTTALDIVGSPGFVNVPAANDVGPLIATWTGYLTAGRHFLVWLEQSQAAGTTTWFGTSAPMRSGLTGTILL